jgi:hypothetical protein
MSECLFCTRHVKFLPHTMQVPSPPLSYISILMSLFFLKKYLIEMKLFVGSTSMLPCHWRTNISFLAQNRLQIQSKSVTIFRSSKIFKIAELFFLSSHKRILAYSWRRLCKCHENCFLMRKWSCMHMRALQNCWVILGNSPRFWLIRLLLFSWC